MAQDRQEQAGCCGDRQEQAVAKLRNRQEQALRLVGRNRQEQALRLVGRNRQEQALRCLGRNRQEQASR